jgi:uncharacterized protein YdeI (YjbR/CyaY-like superfamily)
MDRLLTFPDRAGFRKWLDEFGTESDGVWLLFGKTEKINTLSAGEALEEALCYGWIDGQIQSLDNNNYKKYFARRISNSKWSVKNKELAQTLIAKGLMTQQGFEAIERARKNGFWDNAKRILIEDEQIQAFMEIILPHKLAYSNLQAMSHSIQRTYAGFYFDAKTDKTRQARIEKIIDRLSKNMKPM